MQSRLFATVLVILSGNSTAAPIPVLSKAPPTVCRASTEAQEWQPSATQIKELEKALISYFEEVQESKDNLPAQGVTYARQYTGVVLNGQMLIYGRFYPYADTLPSFAKPGDCWFVSDGGNRHWNIYFNPKSGKVVSHRTNGLG